jgi:hypothetical protein
MRQALQKHNSFRNLEKLEKGKDGRLQGMSKGLSLKHVEIAK